MPVTLTSGTPRALQHATPRASTAPRIPPQRQFATAMPANSAPKPDHALVASLPTSPALPAASASPSSVRTSSQTSAWSESLTVDLFFHLQRQARARKWEGVTAPGAPLPGQRLFQATGKLLRRVNGTLELPPGY